MKNQLNYIYHTEGISGITHRFMRMLFKVKVKDFKKLKKIFEAKSALEIGGPSRTFQQDGLFPVYPLLASVDGCNFSSSTVWEGAIKGGNTYKYEQQKTGHQYIAEASDLSQIDSGSYDVLLSCHSLEHLANPIKALTEWARVLNSKGIMVIILPNPKFTFDHKRPITSLGHLIEDYENNTSEDDLTHAKEIIDLHDLDRDPFSKNNNVLTQEWVSKNHEHRCLHHHVFDTKLLDELLTYMGMEIIKVDEEKPFHLVAVATKK